MAWVEPVVDWLLGRDGLLVNEVVVVTGPRKLEVPDAPEMNHSLGVI